MRGGRAERASDANRPKLLTILRVERFLSNRMLIRFGLARQGRQGRACHDAYAITWRQRHLRIAADALELASRSACGDVELAVALGEPDRCRDSLAVLAKRRQYNELLASEGGEWGCVSRHGSSVVEGGRECCSAGRARQIVASQRDRRPDARDRLAVETAPGWPGGPRSPPARTG